MGNPTPWLYYLRVETFIVIVHVYLRSYFVNTKTIFIHKYRTSAEPKQIRFTHSEHDLHLDLISDT